MKDLHFSDNYRDVCVLQYCEKVGFTIFGRGSQRFQYCIYKI